MSFASQLARFMAHGRVHGSTTVPACHTAIVPGCSPRSACFRFRVETAAELYRTGKVQHLLLSGDGRHPTYDEPAAMRRMLHRLGVPDDAMTEDKLGLSTFETLDRARECLGITTATVITQAFHAGRVALLGKCFGMNLHICLAASPADTSRDEARESRARVRALLDLCGLRRWTERCERERRVVLASVELCRW